MNLRIIDGALKNPEQHRREALGLEFRSYDFGHCVFHGIAVGGPSRAMAGRILEEAPQLQPTLTFFRKSPRGQVEPHFIHTDIDMGEWSGILYLNPEPPKGDGTNFWTHRETGGIENPKPHALSDEGRDPANWDLRQHVEAKFNRLLLFPSAYYHSRAIHENWGDAAEARLIQVTFGKGAY